MTEPFEQRAKYFQRELRSANAINRELRDQLDIVREQAYLFRHRLVNTETFLQKQGYRRLDLEGNWTKEPEPVFTLEEHK